MGDLLRVVGRQRRSNKEEALADAAFAAPYTAPVRVGAHRFLGLGENTYVDLHRAEARLRLLRKRHHVGERERASRVAYCRSLNSGQVVGITIPA